MDDALKKFCIDLLLPIIKKRELQEILNKNFYQKTDIPVLVVNDSESAFQTLNFLSVKSRDQVATTKNFRV
jgi:hypothetical protein